MRNKFQYASNCIARDIVRATGVVDADVDAIHTQTQRESCPFFLPVRQVTFNCIRINF